MSDGRYVKFKNVPIEHLERAATLAKCAIQGKFNKPNKEGWRNGIVLECDLGLVWYVYKTKTAWVVSYEK